MTQGFRIPFFSLGRVRAVMFRGILSLALQTSLEVEMAFRKDPMLSLQVRLLVRSFVLAPFVRKTSLVVEMAL